MRKHWQNGESTYVKAQKLPKPRVSQAIQPLPTEFNCPFCNAEKVCEVKIDKVRRLGTVSCRKCHETFTTSIHRLSEPVDVYSDWIDACEQYNKENKRD
ncbi:transcription elongation factor elf1 like domain-containing protein [Ditylenchus destructor]|uniref:Transcription elongation factor 1 homolog n=1 Tax=Ditylenchus destructor TaxID=166010 RepID=A0AAD4QXQ1_9BILA|nr:transcription elongation factor elf1 like domain-containing protein [Ditylenchus destructor]